jgi:hypothetical protein
MKEDNKNTERQCDIVVRVYGEILRLVEEGWNISEAVAHFGLQRGVFYNNITDLQKQEIYYAKKLHTKMGVGSRSYKETK